jgi:protein SCO1
MLSAMRYLRISHLLFAMLMGGCAETWRSPPEPAASEQPAASLFSYPWTWLDDHGARVALSRWRGSPLVMAAVYTTCFETCPRTLVRLRRIYDEFTRTGRSAEFVVVTVDPVIDTQDRLRQFKQSRNLPESWRLLTGSRQDTGQLMDVLDIHIMEMDAHLVHDSKIILFDGNGIRTAELDVP